MIELIKKKLEENKIRYIINEVSSLTYLYLCIDNSTIYELAPLYVEYSIRIEITHYEDGQQNAYLYICYPKNYDIYKVNESNIEDVFQYLLAVIKTINNFYKSLVKCNKLIKSNFEL